MVLKQFLVHREQQCELDEALLTTQGEQSGKFFIKLKFWLNSKFTLCEPNSKKWRGHFVNANLCKILNNLKSLSIDMESTKYWPPLGVGDSGGIFVKNISS